MMPREEIEARVEEIREAIKSLGKEAMDIHKSLRLPKEEEPLRSALTSVLANVQRAIGEGKTIAGEEDLLTWVRDRIVSAFEKDTAKAEGRQ